MGVCDGSTSITGLVVKVIDVGIEIKDVGVGFGVSMGVRGLRY